MHRFCVLSNMKSSWYACSAIVLAIVEVDMASMCASIPVFWPVLQNGWGRIFVTHEIEVVHEFRLSGETQYADSIRGNESLHTRQGSNSSANFVDIAKMVQPPPAARHVGQFMPYHATRGIIRPAEKCWDSQTPYRPRVNPKEQQGVFQLKQGYEYFKPAGISGKDNVSGSGAFRTDIGAA